MPAVEAQAGEVYKRRLVLPAAVHTPAAWVLPAVVLVAAVWQLLHKCWKDGVSNYHSACQQQVATAVPAFRCTASGMAVALLLFGRVDRKNAGRSRVVSSKRPAGGPVRQAGARPARNGARGAPFPAFRASPSRVMRGRPASGSMRLSLRKGCAACSPRTTGAPGGRAPASDFALVARARLRKRRARATKQPLGRSWLFGGCGSVRTSVIAGVRAA